MQDEQQPQHSPVLVPPLDEPLMNQKLQENFSRLRKRSAENMQQLATETAILVDEEVKRMKASIAELEQLLQDPAENDSVAPPPLAFVLVMRDDDEDNDDDDDCSKDEDRPRSPVAAAATTA